MITLKGISQKGKNRINENGKMWKIINFRESVSFSDKKNWILLESLKNQYKMWILQVDDPDFVRFL